VSVEVHAGSCAWAALAVRASTQSAPVTQESLPLFMVVKPFLPRTGTARARNRSGPFDSKAPSTPDAASPPSILSATPARPPRRQGSPDGLSSFFNGEP